MHVRGGGVRCPDPLLSHACVGLVGVLGGVCVVGGTRHPIAVNMKVKQATVRETGCVGAVGAAMHGWPWCARGRTDDGMRTNRLMHPDRSSPCSSPHASVRFTTHALPTASPLGPPAPPLHTPALRFSSLRLTSCPALDSADPQMSRTSSSSPLSRPAFPPSPSIRSPPLHLHLASHDADRRISPLPWNFDLVSFQAGL